MFIRYINKKKLWLVALVLLTFIIVSVLAVSPQAKNATAPAPGMIELPIIMYHSVCLDPSQSNEYVITARMLEEDLKYLQEHGYQSIFASQLIEYVDYGCPLPPKPILLTFDDGFLNNLNYVLPLLEKYDSKALVSIVGDFTQKYSETGNKDLNYAYLTWDDIMTISQSGYVEIGNHTYNLHSMLRRDGCMKKNSESAKSYQKLLAHDLKNMQNILWERCGITCEVFTYPYGEVSPESLPVIKDLGFRISLSVNSQINKISRDPQCLYLLSRFNRPGKMSTEQFMQRLL